MIKVFAFLMTFGLSISSIAAEVKVNGAGATFPYPLYSKWFSEFTKLKSGSQINYNSIGSGGGIRQLMDNTIDFGASDAFMTEEQMKKAKEKSGAQILHIPTVLGSVVVTYNLPELTQNLKLDAQVISGMFSGKIQKWNDKQIQTLNPGVSLPDLHVTPIYRSDGSGTTAIFTDYLSKASSDWKASTGQGTSVRWKTGLGGKGNEGVTGLVKQTKGAVGYVEYLYADLNSLPMASVKNKSGNFVAPSVKTTTAAAEGLLKSIPSDYRASITNAGGKSSYPISGFTYILIYQSMPKEKGQVIVDFLNWALSDGQKIAQDLKYAPLPGTLAARVKKTIKSVKLQ